ncbi:Uncharacterised protein [Shigella sonnei]|nr:Uncharacterised protein [Shigella sonnei]CSP62544.1 Uncharacterised protein [Shigella sonnei]
MHPQTTRQNVKIHFRHLLLALKITQQGMNYRTKTGNRFQTRRFKICQTHGNVSAETETKGRDASVIHPRYVRQSL